MMTPADFERGLGGLLKRKPFHPFIIEFDDGDQFVVGKPEAVWYSEGSSAVYYGLDGAIDFVNCEAVKKMMELVPAASS